MTVKCPGVTRRLEGGNQLEYPHAFPGSPGHRAFRPLAELCWKESGLGAGWQSTHGNGLVTTNGYIHEHLWSKGETHHQD